MIYQNTVVIGQGESIPSTMPGDAAFVVDIPNSKTYKRGANGTLVEFGQGTVISETGTLTSDWNGDNTSVPYLKQGNIVMLNFRDVVQDTGQSITVLTVPQNIRPSATRYEGIYEGDAVNKVVPVIIGTDGTVSITGAIDYLLIGNLTYFI